MPKEERTEVENRAKDWDEQGWFYDWLWAAAQTDVGHKVEQSHHFESGQGQELMSIKSNSVGHLRKGPE